MSRLRELMKELCPDGVEYKKLGDVVSVCRGVRVVRAELQLVGKYPVYQNSLIPMGYYYKENCIAGTAFIIGAGAAGDIGYSDVPFWAADDCFYFVCEDNMNARFLYHVLVGQETFIKGKVRKASIPRLSRNVVGKMVIPVPPLEIQNEIVKLLDNFTELTAELTLRKKQYNFYRDSLLNFVRVDDTIVQTDRQTDRQAQRISKFGLLWKTFDVEWKTLGEVCGLKAGTAISASCIREQKNDVYKTPCYGGNGLRGHVQEVNHYSDAPLIGRQGALCGNVCFARAPYYATEHAVIVDGKKNFNNRFLFHVLVNMNLGQYKTAGAQPGLSVKRLNKVKIAIPKLEIQNSIANILDRFDTLCNDLTSGLPAEIAARKRQYEHYRDKLLTFPRSKLEERS